MFLPTSSAIADTPSIRRVSTEAMPNGLVTSMPSTFRVPPTSPGMVAMLTAERTGNWRNCLIAGFRR